MQSRKAILWFIWVAIILGIHIRPLLSQPANIAETLFKHNHGRIERTWKQLGIPSKSWPSTQQTTTLLKAAGSSKTVQCFIGVEITPSPLQAHMEGLHSNNATQCTAFKPRIEAFIMALNHFILPRMSNLTLTRPLRFWYDLTPSTVLPEEAYHMLQLPVLTSGAAAHDAGALLIPEIYRFMGMLAGDAELLDRFVALYPHTREFVMGLNHVFEGVHAAHTKPWSEKLDRAVFRGTCMSTFNPDPTPGAAPMLLRGELCLVAHNTAVKGRIPLDVGMTIKSNNDPPLTDRCATPGDLSDIHSSACKLCRECMQEKRMSRQELAMHKYQIAIDGLGATFDALFHKLTSNSVVFVIQTVLQAGKPAVPAHRLWYQTLLQSKVNCIYTTLTQLQKDVDWCADNQKECQKIAQAAMGAMQPLMGNAAVVTYMRHVLEALAALDGQVLTPPNQSKPVTTTPSTVPTTTTTTTTTSVPPNNMLHLPAWHNISRNNSNMLLQLPGLTMPSATSREKDTDDVEVGPHKHVDGVNKSHVLINTPTNRTPTSMLDELPTATGAIQQAMSQAVAESMLQSSNAKKQIVQPVAVHHDDGSFVVRSSTDLESSMSLYNTGPNSLVAQAT